MKVREIMTAEGIATASLDTTLAEIAERMRDENVGAIPIVDDDDKLCGIITDRDIVVRAVAEGEDPGECTAEEILSEQLHTIDPDADIEDAADLMAEHQIRRLPVVEDEVVIGIISLGDLAVKSEEDEASDVLEDVSEGVRQSSGHGQQGRQQTAERGEEQARKRANQQQSTRGRQSASARGRQSGELRESGTSARSPGISNRSQKEESQRQQKVTPMRADARGGARGKNRRKAS